MQEDSEACLDDGAQALLGGVLRVPLLPLLPESKVPELLYPHQLLLQRRVHQLKPELKEALQRAQHLCHTRRALDSQRHSEATCLKAGACSCVHKPRPFPAQMPFRVRKDTTVASGALKPDKVPMSDVQAALTLLVT